MARLATLALLLLSLLSVASCRDLEAISDDQGPPVPVLLTRADQADAAAEVTTLPSFPAPVVAWDADELPSHRGHLWLARPRHHGFFHRRGAFSGLGEARVQPAAFFPTEPDRGEEQAHWETVLEVVAEPEPDTHGEQKPFHAEEGEGNEAVKAWKVEMMASMFVHGVGLHHRHHHDQEEEHDHRQDKDEEMNTKLLGRLHLHAHDGDHEADELGELARRVGPATRSTRRSFNHGDHHLGAEEAGGVKKWFKVLMNRF
ncbi:hypothetical protein ACQJBY_029653 [Aegilops geniculata]